MTKTTHRKDKYSGEHKGAHKLLPRLEGRQVRPGHFQRGLQNVPRSISHFVSQSVSQSVSQLVSQLVRFCFSNLKLPGPSLHNHSCACFSCDGALYTRTALVFWIKQSCIFCSSFLRTLCPYILQFGQKFLYTCTRKSKVTD